MDDLRKVTITIEGPRACGKTQIADIISKALGESTSPVQVRGIKRHYSGTTEVLEVTFNLSF